MRLCCGMRHYGPQCPDGKVMCCLCFCRFDLYQLAEEGGKKTDVCSSCAIEDARGCLKRAADQLDMPGRAITRDDPHHAVLRPRRHARMQRLAVGATDRNLGQMQGHTGA